MRCSIASRPLLHHQTVRRVPASSSKPSNASSQRGVYRAWARGPLRGIVGNRETPWMRAAGVRGWQGRKVAKCPMCPRTSPPPKRRLHLTSAPPRLLHHQHAGSSRRLQPVEWRGLRYTGGSEHFALPGVDPALRNNIPQRGPLRGQLGRLLGGLLLSAATCDGNRRRYSSIVRSGSFLRRSSCSASSNSSIVA